MMRQFTIVLAAMATAVLAQSSTTTTASTASATSSAAAATHTVKVGYPIGQHAFSPAQTTANLGDTIVFEFLPSNHSVVHMDPASPCIPWDTAGNPKNQAWWSGFYPVSDASKPSYYDIVVDTTDPIWFYCSAPDSCITYRMVGVINPANSSDLAAVQKLASQADYSLSPGESIPNEDGSTPGASSTASSSSSSSGGSSLSGGAIAGIVIGAVAAFALIGLLFFFVGRRKKAAEVKAKNDAETAAAAAASAPQDQPPMYQDPNNPAFMDPRYSMVPGSPTPEQWGTVKTAHTSPHQSFIPDASPERNPNRLSELPSQNYDPVEIYTPGQSEFPQSPASPTPANGDEEMGDRRRDTYH